MKRCMMATVVVVSLGISIVAGAQGKDPFRPPPGFGEEASTAEAPTGGTVRPPAEPEAPPGAIVRTGQDVAALMAFGVLFVAVGVGMRAAERGLSLRAGIG